MKKTTKSIVQWQYHYGYFFNKYECHINFEYCGSIAGIKYIYNYLHKGLDNNTVQEITDEISTFIHGRYISGTETAWRLQEFPIGCRSHSVVRLAVHTENQQQIIFEKINPGEALNIGKLDLDEIDDFAKNINYINIPQY